MTDREARRKQNDKIKATCSDNINMLRFTVGYAKDCHVPRREKFLLVHQTLVFLHTLSCAVFFKSSLPGILQVKWDNSDEPFTDGAPDGGS